MHNGKWGHYCSWSWVCKVLLIVGGVNWGLVGLGMLMDKGMEWNVVHMLLGDWMMLEAIVYLLVGVAAVMKIFGCRCKTCTEGVCGNCGAPGQVENKM